MLHTYCFVVEGFTSRSSKEPLILPTAPRAARGPYVVEEDIPDNPPYVAYLTNLPYEVDESYLTEFFTGTKASTEQRVFIISQHSLKS